MSDTVELAWFKSSYSGTEGDNCVEVALAWHKSSYSSDQGDNCVEVGLAWHKSTHSTDQGDDCIEVAATPTTIHLRDSKDRTRPHLALTPAAWAPFVVHAAGAA